MSEALDIQVIETAEAADSIVVNSPETYVAAAEALKAAKALQREIKEFFDPLKKAAKEAHHKLCESEKEKLAPLDAAIADIGKKLTAYDQEQERLRREEEARLRELAAKREEEARLMEAIELEAMGETAEANRIIDEPPPPTIVRVEKATPQVSGVSFRASYRAEVTDLRALVRAVADGKVPLLAIVPSETFLNQQARAMKETLDYPGVAVIRDRTVTTRR